MRVIANGIDFHCRIEGHEGAPHVEFCNALTSDLSLWDGQVEALADCFRVLRYDTCGYGQTQATPGPYTLELLAEDARALLAALEISRTHFDGISLGGMTAQVLAAAHSELVHGLVICDTASVFPAERRAAYAARLASVLADSTAMLVPAMLERWLTAPFREAKPETVERVAAMMISTSVVDYVGCVQAVQALDIRHYHPRIEAPTLIIVGGEDHSTPLAWSVDIHGGIRGSRLAVIESASHLPNLEQLEAFTAALFDFWLVFEALMTALVGHA